MSEAKHKEYLPFKHNIEAGCIEDSKGRMIADLGFLSINSRIIGDFICLASNNHDALVKALSSLDDWVKANTIASNRPAKLDALIMNVFAQIEKEQGNGNS